MLASLIGEVILEEKNLVITYLDFQNKKKKYEEIIIPYIKREIFESMDKHKKNGTKILVLDAPTLIENDLHKEVDYVILVWVDQNTQIQRVRARDGI